MSLPNQLWTYPPLPQKNKNRCGPLRSLYSIKDTLTLKTLSIQCALCQCRYLVFFHPLFIVGISEFSISVQLFIPYCTVVLMIQTRKSRGVRPHLVLACGCEPEPEDNWQADRRCSTPCRRPAGQPHRGQCCWCRTAAGSCSSVSEGGKRINPVSIM